MDGNWQVGAVCGDQPTEVFFTERRIPTAAELERARRICVRCPVRVECLAYALEHPRLTEDGIWAGFSAPQRRTLRRLVCRSCRSGDPVRLWNLRTSSRGRGGCAGCLRETLLGAGDLAGAMATFRGVVQVHSG